jgi:type II secretory pathway pseudopilin PulG
MEVLAVVAILGLLAVVALVASGTLTNSAQRKACDADRRVLESAVDSYKLRTGYLPSNQGILVSVALVDRSSLWNYSPPVDLRDGEPSFTPAADCQ